MFFEELWVFSVVLVTYSSSDPKKETPQEIALRGFLHSILFKTQGPVLISAYQGLVK